MKIYNPFRIFRQTAKVAFRYPAKNFKHRCLVIGDYIHLFFSKGLMGDEYIEYLFHQCTPEFRSSFLGLNEERYYLDYLNPEKYYILARNKYFAHKLLEGVGIRKAEVYCYYQPEGRFSDSAHTAGNLEDVLYQLGRREVQSCVIKATEGSHGDDVWVVKHIDYEQGDARLQLYNDESKMLSDVLKDKPLLFESPVTQTKQLAALNPSSVNTVRFMTTLYPNGEARLVATFIKIGRAGSCVDNAGSGGNVDACIDMETGELQYAIRYDGIHKHPEINVHPDTHCPINGTIIESWDSIKEQVLQYQRSFPYIKAAGWDIAITNEGPVVIEVNDMWDRLGQLFIRRGWRFEIRNCYRAWKKTGKKYPFGRLTNKLCPLHLRRISQKN